MKRGLTFLLLLLFSMASIQTIYAQVDNNYIQLVVYPEDARPCDTSSVEVEILFKATKLSSIAIQFNLPEGVTYVDNSFKMLNSPNGLYLGASPSYSAASPIFQIHINNGGDAKLGDAISFKFSRYISCSAINGLNNGDLFKDIQIVQLEHDGVGLAFENNDPKVSNYQVLIPTLALQSIADADVIVGQTISRNVTMVQGGEGRLKWYVHKVHLDSEIGNYSLSYNGTTLTPDSTSGSDLFYYVYLDKAPYAGIVGDGNQFFDNGETVQFVETFQVQGCTHVELTHQGFWGCSLDELCQASTPELGVLNFQGSAPQITIKKIAGDNYMDICGNQNFTVRVKNNATHPGAMAKDINTNIGLGHNSSPLSDYDKNPFWDFDYRGLRKINNIKINGIPVATSNWASTLYPALGSGNSIRIPSDYFTSDPDGPGGLEDIDGDGYYDDLAPGAYFDISFDYELDLKTGCGEKRFDYGAWEHLYIDEFFKDQCDNYRYTERIDFEYANIIRDYHIQTTTDSPSFVDDGKGFYFKINPYLFRADFAPTLGYPRCNGEDIFSGSSVVWTIEINVPNGVSLQASAPAAFTQNGNTITYTQSGYQYKEYKFPLVFDCAGYTGGENFSIDYKTHYHCSCWDEDIHCGSVKIQSLCPTLCKGPAIIDFKANRTVAGWTDPTKSTKVILGDNYAINDYMPKDTMQIEAKAAIQDSMVNNLFFDVDFKVENGGGVADLLQFIDGTIEIEDLSSGTVTGTIATTPTVTTISTNYYRISFDLSSYTNLVSNTYNYGEGDENDTVSLKLNFVVNKNFTPKKYFKLKTFTAKFNAKDLAGTPKGCGFLTQQMRYVQIVRQTSDYSPINTYDVETPDQVNAFWSLSDVGDIFPNEFRNPIDWDSTLIILPKGVRFTGYASYYNGMTPATPGQNTNDGKIKYTLSGDSLTLYPTASFIPLDQSGTIWAKFRPKFIGTCEALPDVKYNYTVFYKKYAYVNPEPISKSGNPTFHYFRPMFELHASHPTVTVIDNEPHIDVQICNTIKVPIDYNWIQVDNNPNFTVTKAFLLDGADNEVQAVNFTSKNGTTWVEAGQIKNGPASCKTIRIYGAISDCGDQTITVSNGWDCQKYPDDYESLDAYCYQKTLDIKLAIQTAQVQTYITHEPDSIQYCSQFSLGLEVNSAQVANLLDPYLLISIPGDISSMGIDDILVEYPKNSGNKESLPFSIVGNKLKISLNNHSIIAQNGMLGSYVESDEEKRIASVEIKMALDCSFLNLSTIDVKAFGKSPCDQLAASSGVNVTTKDILVKGANTSYYAFSEFYMPDTLKNCSIQQTIDVKTTIIAGTTGIVDSADITIPNGLALVAGTFACTSPNCATFEYAYSSGGQDHFVIAFPQGVGNVDTINYQFDVISGNSYCGEELFDIESYIYSTGGTCGTAECGAIKIPTGHQKQSIIIAKPDLIIQSTTVATYNKTTNGFAKYGLNLNIKNIGIDATAGYNYTIYCADASGNPSTSIYTGDFSDILAAGDSLSQKLYFYGSTTCDPANGLVFEIVPSNSNCLCDIVRTVIQLTEGMDANDDYYTTPEDTKLIGLVTANDIPTNASVLLVSQLGVSHGTLSLDGDGGMEYMPALDYNGPDSFVYEVCDDGNPQLCDTATVYITVTPVNDPPVAVDDYYTVLEDHPLAGWVLDNDNDPDGGSLTTNTTPILSPVNGDLTIYPDGSFDYGPDINFYGLDSFYYEVCNDGAPIMCDTAVVYITVTPVNDPPVAMDDYYTTPEETLLVGDVRLNDVDPEDTLTVNTTPISNVTHGTLTLNSNGQFTYLPDLDYFGSDSFSYQVCDDSIPALCDIAVVYITVTPVNDPPIAVDDHYSTDTNTPLTGENVTDNDNDVDGDGLIVNTAVLSGPTQGSVTLYSNGTFTYTPNANFNGYDAFEYIVCDNGSPSLCDTAKVFIKVGNLQVNIALPDTLDCITSTVIIDGSGSSQGDYFAYTWSTTNGHFLSGVGGQTVTVDKPGDYTLTLLDQISLVTSSSTVTVVIDTLAPTASIVLPHDYINCIQSSVFLSGNGSDVGANYAYSWITSNGTIAGDNTGLVVEANKGGNYQLKVTNTNTGCSAVVSTLVEYDTIAPTVAIAPVSEKITCSTPCIDINANGTSNGSNISYLWSTANGSIQTGQSSLTPTVCSAGDYNLLVTNTYNGCTISGQAHIEEDTAPPTVTTASSQKLSCDVTQVPIEATVAEPGTYTYVWSPAITIVSGTNTANPMVNQAGEYTVTVTNASTGCTSEATILVEATSEIPVGTLSALDTLTCKDTLVAINANFNSNYSVLWSTTVGKIESGYTMNQAIVSLPGTYTATITDPDNGCSSTTSVVVQDNTTAPMADADDVQKQDCSTTYVMLGNPDQANQTNVQYEWTTLDGHFVSSSYLANPIIDVIGTYHLKVTDLHNGCSAEDQVIVNEVAPLGGANIELSLPGCDGRPGAIIIKDVVGSTGPFSYSFDGGLHFGTMPILGGLEPGDYDIVIQDEMGCEYTETVTLPIPEEGDILVDPDIEITLGDSTTLEVFTTTPTDAIDTILWTPVDGLYCLDNCFKQTVKPLKTTIYKITIVDSLGCIASVNATVHVADPDIYIPNVFSPNDGDGQNDFFTVMGNTERVTEIVSMQIFDRWGNHVFSKEHFSLNDYGEGWDGTFRGKRVIRGVYVYSIKVRYIDGREVSFQGDLTVIN